MTKDMMFKDIWRGAAVAVLVTLFLNGLLFAFGWAGANSEALRGHQGALPPGWVIGTVWSVLLGEMGAIFVFLRRMGQGRLATEVGLFMVFCWAYPLYTLGFTHALAIYAGNVLSIAAAAFVAGRLWAVHRICALGLLLPSLWVCYATLAKIDP